MTITTKTITKRQTLRGHGLRDTWRRTMRLTPLVTVDKSEDKVRDTTNDESKLGQHVGENEIGEGQRGKDMTRTNKDENKWRLAYIVDDVTWEKEKKQSWSWPPLWPTARPPLPCRWPPLSGPRPPVPWWRPPVPWQRPPIPCHPYLGHPSKDGWPCLIT